VSNEEHVLGVIVSNLLYGEENRDKLMERIWDQWTPEQRQALADAAHRAAMDRMAKIIESKLWSVGQGGQRTNMFARYVEATVRKVFETDDVKGAVEREAKAHIDNAMSSLPETIKALTAEFVTKLIRELFSRLDSHTIRTAVDAVLSQEKD
jgi:predicted sugar kinase